MGVLLYRAAGSHGSDSGGGAAECAAEAAQLTPHCPRATELLRSAAAAGGGASGGGAHHRTAVAGVWVPFDGVKWGRAADWRVSFDAAACALAAVAPGLPYILLTHGVAPADQRWLCDRGARTRLLLRSGVVSREDAVVVRSSRREGALRAPPPPRVATRSVRRVQKWTRAARSGRATDTLSPPAPRAHNTPARPACARRASRSRRPLRAGLRRARRRRGRPVREREPGRRPGPRRRR